MVTLRAPHWSPPPQLASDWLELVVTKSLPSRLHFHSLRLAQWRRPGQAGWAWTWRFSLWPSLGQLLRAEAGAGQAGPVLTGKETWCDWARGPALSLGSTSQCHGLLSPLSHFPTRDIRHGGLGWGSTHQMTEFSAGYDRDIGSSVHNNVFYFASVLMNVKWPGGV